MTYIAALTPLPQIVVVQEALQSQFDTYINELQNRTGLAWRGVFATHCAPGAWTNGGCSAAQDEGVGILSSSGPGYTANTPNPTMHLDYWFSDISNQIRPSWATVVTAPGALSDHFPVHAAFLLGAPPPSPPSGPTGVRIAGQLSSRRAGGGNVGR